MRSCGSVAVAVERFFVCQLWWAVLGCLLLMLGCITHSVGHASTARLWQPHMLYTAPFEAGWEYVAQQMDVIDQLSLHEPDLDLYRLSTQTVSVMCLACTSSYLHEPVARVW